ncbi:MAG TPA: PfkB family carbohydrate kinase [Microbacterium sp.]|uniref:PfkB family carbohydrate kinase n=1 Tax=Microbacterium sp. TaxID=51671 RepID=UPI002B45B84D|nr:PfkB family carbohydrate kinase [Microbacterium sp.]HKT57183.1 PfkB family carbohydrate kinase [Microbacterium sp.]
MTHRPVIHFTPARNWMNDPNGLVFHNGRYHLFFQHNPHGLAHATIGWGHASSPDLLTWTEHPVAIEADATEQIFSGSVVIDHDNTAGFAGPGETALVAVYTSLAAGTGIQSQALAFSVDDGLTWTKYAGNPVLDRGSLEFRDPKVFRYDGPAGSYWVMVAVEAVDRQVLLHRSDDLKTWTFLSAYGPAGAVGGVWECPDLFPLAVDGDPDDVRWVLVISLNPGGIAGGSGTQYVVGRFDGVEFTPDEPRGAAGPGELDELDWLDYGRDCYAGVSFHGLPDDRRTLIAWMSNWDYAHHLPDGAWRGAMTTPRRLALTSRQGRAQLTARPILPVGERVGFDPDADILPLPRAARIDLRATGDVELEFSGLGGPVVLLRCSPGEIVLDRSQVSGIHPAFPSVERMPVPDAAEVTIVIDATSIEVFAAEGLRTLTDLVPWRGAVTLHARSAGGVVERLEVRDLAPGSAPAPVLVVGESLIDVVDRNGDRARHVGGSPLNVAYGLGRLGIPAVFATEFGDDADGDAIAQHLASVGVPIERTDDTARATSTAIAHIGPEGAAVYEFDLDWTFRTPPAVADVAAVHVGSIGALRLPGAERVLAFVEALPGDVLVTFDPNVRPAVVPPVERTRELVERYAARAAVVKLSDEDAAWLYPGGVDEAAARLLGCGARLVAVTCGAEGSDLHTGSTSVHVPARPTRVVDTIGAGDAYMTGLVAAIVTGIGAQSVLDGALTVRDLERIGRVAAAAAAITVGRSGAMPPTAAELARALRDAAVASPTGR